MKGYWAMVEWGMVLLAGSMVGRGARGVAIGQPVSLPIRPSAMALNTQSGHVFLAGLSLTSPHRVSVVMLDSGTGQVLHTSLLSGMAMPSWLVVDGATHRAFVALTGGGFGSFAVATFDTVTGALLQTVSTGLHVGAGSKHAPAPQSVMQGRGRLALDGQTGRVFMLNPMIVNNRPMSSVSVLDARSGAVIRTVALDPADYPSTIAVDTKTGNAFITSSANTVLTFAPASGRITHSTGIGAHPAASAVDGAVGHLIVASSGPPSVVSMLDTQSGHLLATIPLNTTVSFSPYSLAIDEATHRAFVLNRETANPATGEPTGQGSVLVLDTRAGQYLHTVTLGSNTGALAVDGQRGRVFVLNWGTASKVNGIVHPHDDGSISVLDALTGSVLHTIPAGGNPEGIAIDSQSGRVIVAGVKSAPAGHAAAMNGYVVVFDASG